MTYVARAVLGLSSALTAALALLPPLVAGLILLFDLVAHALFGVSNAMLGVPGAVLPVAPGGDVLPWTGIALSPAATALVSAAEGIPPLCLFAVALRPELLRGTGRKVVFNVLVVLSLVAVGFPAVVLLLPGALAAIVLQFMVRGPRLARP